MYFSDEAVVLSLGRFRESDLWLRLLSPTRGIFTVFAFGGSKSRKRFCGCLDILNKLSISVSQSKKGEYLCLDEAVLRSGPLNLRSDFKRLGIVMNTLKFLEAFGVSSDSALNSFTLFNELLLLSEDEKQMPELFPLLFRLRLAFDHGYSINLESCGNCQSLLKKQAKTQRECDVEYMSNLAYDLTYKQESCYLLASEGQVFCEACASKIPVSGGTLSRLSTQSLHFLHLIKTLPLSDWHYFQFDSLTRRELSRSIDAFIEYHVGLRWHNGRFIRC
ncbi:DNA repair protein RecO [Desulfovibrio litoralis]|uniref:DNA repair protein RecO n=1 Tax=Desulfovibrio litoralis DSM 11393 TaxID=1121455 RepID=A0A1M7RVQ5_9BACT|nr:recombination protein O N-terminal domain-containing protein [Desulfovibrio litoralis]SHN50300.1 DNA replication and repair protein RecO [Desulfovibrio litoralis DSM 11393]